MNALGEIKRPGRWLFVIIAASVILRIAAAIYMGNRVEILPGIFDQISYDALARRVMEGYGFSFAGQWWPLTAAGEPTAHWSYIYTLYLTALYSLFGPNPVVARLIQAVIVGVAHPYIAYRLGSQVFGQKTGLLAAAFTAIYIYFIYYSAALMTEPFYMTAILAILYGLVRLRDVARGAELRWALAVGLGMGVAVLLRQLFLLIIPFLLAWLWGMRFWDARPVQDPARTTTTGNGGAKGFLRSPYVPWRSSIVIIGIVAAMTLPFTLYNYSRFDRFVLLNTNAGFAFFWANHPVYGTRFQAILPPELGTYQNLIPAELRELDEPALEQALLARGLQFVADDPGRYIRLSISRIPVYFMFWPSADSGKASNISRVGSFGLFMPLMLAGLVTSLINRNIRRRSLGESLLLILFAALYSAVHILTWSMVRYRLPVDAVLLVYAGLAGAVVWTKLEHRWRK